MQADLFQAVLYVGALIAIAIPLGAYMARVFMGEAQFLGPIERIVTGAALGAAPQQQTWVGYAAAMLVFNAAGLMLLFALLMLQGALPLNPRGSQD